MLQPGKTKFRKQHKGRIHGKPLSGSKLNFGSYGWKVKTPGRISARQIESARRAITREMHREGRVWIRIFPDKPITKKPLEVRQGKGKGNVEFWVCPIKPGKILYEMEGVEETLAREAFALAASKIPESTSFIKRI